MEEKMRLLSAMGGGGGGGDDTNCAMNYELGKII